MVSEEFKRMGSQGSGAVSIIEDDKIKGFL